MKPRSECHPNPTSQYNPRSARNHGQNQGLYRCCISRPWLQSIHIDWIDTPIFNSGHRCHQRVKTRRQRMPPTGVPNCSSVRIPKTERTRRWGRCARYLEMLDTALCTSSWLHEATWPKKRSKRNAPCASPNPTQDSYPRSKYRPTFHPTSLSHFRRPIGGV